MILVLKDFTAVAFSRKLETRLLLIEGKKKNSGIIRFIQCSLVQVLFQSGYMNSETLKRVLSERDKNLPMHTSVMDLCSEPFVSFR